MTLVRNVHMKNIFWNALVHVIYSRVSGQYYHTIHINTHLLT